MPTNKILLKWESFQSNIWQSFQDVKDDSDFSDVTLVCEDGTIFEVHRVIIAVSSGFFNRILRKVKNSHPLVYMKGMKGHEAKAVVDFIYNGEVTISEEELDSFLDIAKELDLKGINEQIQEIKKSTTSKENVNTKLLFNISDEIHDQCLDIDKELELEVLNEQIKEVMKPSTSLENVNSKLPSNADQTTSANQTDTTTNTRQEPAWSFPEETSNMKFFSNHENLDEMVESMMESLGSSRYCCKVCGKEEKRTRGNMKNHIEGKHIEGVSHPCPLCGKLLKTRVCLAMHINRVHNKST